MNMPLLDMHSHILAGVDDGAPTPAETRRMLWAARDAGVTDLVATPHFRPDAPLAPERIGPAFEEASAMAQAVGIRLYQGYEVDIAALAPMDAALIRRLLIQDTDFLLLELLFDRPAVNWRQALRMISAHGRIIVAHVERYAYARRDPAFVETLLAMGLALQVDAGSLLLGMLDPVGRFARTLVRNGWASYVASDAHGTGDYRRFAKAYAAFAPVWPDGAALLEVLRSPRKEEADAIYGRGEEDQQGDAGLGQGGPCAGASAQADAQSLLS